MAATVAILYARTLEGRGSPALGQALRLSIAAALCWRLYRGSPTAWWITIIGFGSIGLVGTAFLLESNLADTIVGASSLAYLAAAVSLAVSLDAKAYLHEQHQPGSGPDARSYGSNLSRAQLRGNALALVGSAVVLPCVAYLALTFLTALAHAGAMGAVHYHGPGPNQEEAAVWRDRYDESRRSVLKFVLFAAPIPCAGLLYSGYLSWRTSGERSSRRPARRIPRR